MMLDESETLDAVYSFLAQFDLPTSLVDEEHRPVTEAPTEPLRSTRGSSDNLTVSTTASEESNPKEPKKSRRVSRKQQIETARKEVQDLKEELQILAHHRKCMSQIGSRRPSLWQEIASRQLEHRKKSEEENGELREMVQIQVHEARNLRRVLKRRTKLEMMESMLGVKRGKSGLYSIPEDNAQVFEGMLQDMDELYIGVDALFNEKGLHELPCPGRRIDAKRHVTNGVFIELLQRHMVPFGLRTTEKAMWKSMRPIAFQSLSLDDARYQPQFHAHHIEETMNTLKTSFCAEISSLDEVSGVQFRKVVQKYVEEDRIVIICKDLMEPILNDKSKTSGFHTRTTLRIVIRRDTSVVGEEQTISLIESHFTATRHDQGLPAASAIRKSPNLDAGSAAWDEAISRIAHQVESLAIDEPSS